MQTLHANIAPQSDHLRIIALQNLHLYANFAAKFASQFACLTRANLQFVLMHSQFCFDAQSKRTVDCRLLKKKEKKNENSVNTRLFLNFL